MDVDPYPRAAVDWCDETYGVVSCSGFDTIGPPCAACPNDQTCGILKPDTRMICAAFGKCSTRRHRISYEAERALKADFLASFEDRVDA